MTDKISSAGARGVSWRETEVLDLLTFRREQKIQDALKSSRHNIDLFERIDQQMTMRGHKRSALECRTKTKAMRLEYKHVVAHNSISGNVPMTCAYYRELDQILHGDASVNPKRIAQSTVVQVVRNIEGRTLQLQEGSEELFSHEFVTIDNAPLRTSTPAEEGDTKTSCSADVPVSDPGNTPPPEEAEEVSADSNSSSSAQAAQPPKSTAELSPRTRLNMMRSKKKRYTKWDNAADRMMIQSENEHLLELEEQRQANLESREWRGKVLFEENRRHSEFMDESRSERLAFQEAWQQNLSIMKEAVSTLHNLGEIMILWRTAEKENAPPTQDADCDHGT